MTEAEWLACTDPQKMLEFLQGKGSVRKMRLFAIASVHLVWEWVIHPNSQRAVETSELVVEGICGTEDLGAEHKIAWNSLPMAFSDRHILAARAAAQTAREPAYDAARLSVEAIRKFFVERLVGARVWDDENSLVHRLFQGTEGQKRIVERLREIFSNPFRPVTLNHAYLTWNDRTIPKLAQSIYAERAFGRLPILADALEEAGCQDQEILAHCRQPGEHVRGCWVVDLILDKE
jgi:hypothetical protein